MRTYIYVHQSIQGQTMDLDIIMYISPIYAIVQELCESRGGRPGLSVLTSLLVSVDVKLY